jgi:RNA polymerase sigma factor (sigma-70 family)
MATAKLAPSARTSTRKRRCMRRSPFLGHNTRVTDHAMPLNTQTDELVAWVQAIAAGSAKAHSGSGERAQRAWSAVYDATVQRVHAMVRRYVHEDSAAQEVTEDVFYQVWVHANRFDPARGSVIAWLLTMARSRALDAWRKHQAQPVRFDGDIADDNMALLVSPQTPLDLLTEMDNTQALHAAMAQVPAAARQMLSLAFFQGLTHMEISAHMQVPLGTVKTTIRRALISLREHLQLSLPIDEPVALLVEELPHG